MIWSAPLFRIGSEFHAHGALARHVGLLPEAAEKKLHDTFPHGSKVELFGGEPLSASTEAIVRYIAGKAVDHGMVVTAITNGVELEHFANVPGPDSLAELQII